MFTRSIPTIAALGLAMALHTAPVAAQDLTVLMQAPPPAPFAKVSELVALPDFLPGLGQLFIDPATLPAGPFLGYDHDGKLSATIYMVAIKALQDGTAFNDLAMGSHDVASVDIYCLNPESVRSLIFPPMSQNDALRTAQFPFQSCPDCSRPGLALRHWRRAWAVDCQMCGTRLLSIFAKPEGELASEKLLRCARRGAGHLELTIASNSTARLRRAMRAVTFAMALKTVRGDTAFALQHPRSGVRIFCLAAIAAAQIHPLTKAAMFSRSIEGFARAALLRTYEKEPRLLATVDRIARRNLRKPPPQEAESHI